VADETAGPSTALRFGRDDNSFWERTKGRVEAAFITFDRPQADDSSGRDDKGEGGASIQIRGCRGRDDTSFLGTTCQPKRDCYPGRSVPGLPTRRTKLTSIWQRCQISPLFYEDGQDDQLIYLDILPWLQAKNQQPALYLSAAIYLLLPP
jgi:hypothetical protein